MLNTKIQVLIEHNIYHEDDPRLIGKASQLDDCTAVWYLLKSE